ncbi:substrate-binding periplasmic protein [Devosia ginsengisoli]|uniref:Amino acid ABC transporter substrate-binding protein n=1 Tax=Devosia ginsengisoli TaxID=400770 RepID=A0A5B8LSX2_9HYPH|nr:transporter substrate-binding domain-containing protein [Devosia ginsengisoli]QDZ11293.1 amino acid ABC transporter substrate-binding protein [Devosia ginsengisoli]
MVLLRLAVTVLVFALAAPVVAQEAEFDDVPFAPGQWNIGRRLDESQLRYCIDKRDPDWEVAGTIADTIAAALLLEPQRYVVESEIVVEDITKIYAVMLEHCDVYMGFKLIPEGYASWIALTRAYYDAQYVFVASDPALTALADLPPGRPIGATVGTTAHLRLVSYLSALPADRRWPAYPMGTNDQALASLLNGSVDVALVWAPSLWGKQHNDPAYAALHSIAPDPLPPTTLGVGAVVLSDQKFLRNAIDEAIAALAADGTLAGILESFDFPATVAAP